jgi:hypothetical protein
VAILPEICEAVWFGRFYYICLSIATVTIRYRFTRTSAEYSENWPTPSTSPHQTCPHMILTANQHHRRRRRSSQPVADLFNIELRYIIDHSDPVDHRECMRGVIVNNDQAQRPSFNDMLCHSAEAIRLTPAFRPLSSPCVFPCRYLGSES